MNNTKRAVRAFYLEPRRYHGLLAAKLTFPFFYRRFLKWIGEIPGEPDTERLNTFLKVSGHTAKDITLVIPLKERYLIFWWGSGDGEIDNEVILCPKYMVKNGVIDNVSATYLNLHSEMIFWQNRRIWENCVWNSK